MRPRALALGLRSSLSLRAAPAAQTLELGANDSRVSFTGVDGDIDSDAGFPATPYDAGRDRHLVVWLADPGAAPLVDGESEIYERFLDAGPEVLSRPREERSAPTRSAPRTRRTRAPRAPPPARRSAPRR